MFPIISIGPLSLPAAPLIVLLGIWIGSWLMARQAKATGASQEVLDQLLWTALAAGIIGARLSYIARNPWAFQGQVLSIFSLNPALLDAWGGLLIALAAGYYLISRNNLDFRKTLDGFVPFLAVLSIALSAAMFASGDAFGKVADLPWAISLWGAPRHPVQLYYSVSGLVVLTLVLSGKLNQSQTPGRLFASFLVLTAGYFTFLSAFQDPAGQTVLGLRLFQLGSWAVFSIGVILYPSSTQEISDEKP